MSSENLSNLQQAIIRTVIFYDLFDFPLSPYEIFLNLGTPANLTEVLEELDEPESGEYLGNKNGLYFLKGRDSICRTRQERYAIACRKFKTAVRAARLFSRLPWIKLIAVGNIIGANNAKENSDIDLLIATQGGRIWLSRFFCVLAAKIFGWRPQGENTRDKICLSFFVAENAIDLESFMLNGDDSKGKDDPYFVYWLANLTVVYDRGGMADRFVRENRWIRRFLPNWVAPAISVSRLAEARADRTGSALADYCLAPLESRLKGLQLKIMPGSIKDLANRDTRVVVNDRALKLHVNDRRERIRDEYYGRVRRCFKFED